MAAAAANDEAMAMEEEGASILMYWGLMKAKLLHVAWQRFPAN